MPKFFITTAIDYPTASPHMGHAYEKIAADIVARFRRMQGFDVLLTAGTDEHGIKLQRAAEKAGLEPKQFVDLMSEKFRFLYKALDVSYDDFIRTTEQRHADFVNSVYAKIRKDVYKGTYSGLYCVDCEAFYTEAELVNGNCPVHGTKPEFMEEESYFFRMSKYQPRLVKHIEDNHGFIQPESRRREILRRLEQPLRDLSISRSTFHWGIPLPDDPRHVFYVWVDALMNYNTVALQGAKDYWPADVHVIGKDIIWHHAVVYPSLLLSAGIQLPKSVQVHGFITLDGRKMSKSRGTVVDPLAVAEKYGSDYLRFFLARNIPFGEDGDFSYSGLVSRVNTELIDNYGNLFYRVMSFIEKEFGGTVPKPGDLGKDETELHKKLRHAVEAVEKSLNSFRIDEALKSILELSTEANRYFQKKKPWESADPNTTLYTAVNVLHTITQLLCPYVPKACMPALDMLGGQKPWHEIGEFSIKPKSKLSSSILFQKLEVSAQPGSHGISLDIVAGTISSVVNHPDADKLYVLKVDAGEPLQVVAGIRENYSITDLLGKQVVLLANLEHRKIRGVESQGMILATEDGTLIVPEKPVPNGERASMSPDELSPRGNVAEGDSSSGRRSVGDSPSLSSRPSSSASISHAQFSKHEIVVGPSQSVLVDGQPLKFGSVPVIPAKPVKEGSKIR